MHQQEQSPQPSLGLLWRFFAVAAQEKVSQVEPCSVYILNRNDEVF